jgi:glyoxylase I family protein
MITGIAHVCYSVKDLDRSLKFYCDGLGLPLAFDFKDKEGKRFGVYLHAGHRTFIEIFKGEPGPHSDKASLGHICLEVDNLEKTVAEIRKKGIQATDPFFADDNAWQSWITDPDGNRIELHYYTPESWQTPSLKK